MEFSMLYEDTVFCILAAFEDLELDLTPPDDPTSAPLVDQPAPALDLQSQRYLQYLLYICILIQISVVWRGTAS